jgi:hypothetical protein
MQQWSSPRLDPIAASELGVGCLGRSQLQLWSQGCQAKRERPRRGTGRLPPSTKKRGCWDLMEIQG